MNDQYTDYLNDCHTPTFDLDKVREIIRALAAKFSLSYDEAEAIVHEWLGIEKE